MLGSKIEPEGTLMAKIRSTTLATGLRPSEVFAQRLREIRDARRLTQAELAEKMTRAGRPMNKLAVLRVERGERKVSLDEALAFAYVLGAVPAHLLSPPDDEHVAVTDQFEMDGEGMRGWLRFGLDLIADAGDLGPERVEELRLRGIAVLARAYLDAVAGNDKAGRRDALLGLNRLFTTPDKTPAELGLAPAAITVRRGGKGS
jgi:transcriptional regulator with XRE-family HTH domain